MIMSQYVSPYMIGNEYLDIREVVSLSVVGEVLKGEKYKSNNDIKELERKLLRAIMKNEINAKKYPLYKVAIFFFTNFNCLPPDCRIRMRPADVTELYKKWGYPDRCFNIEQTQSEPAPPKIPWNAPENSFAEFVAEFCNKGYIVADSESDALKKVAPHFAVNSNCETLRKGLERKRESGYSNFDSIPKARDFEKGCFADIEPAKMRRNKGVKKVKEEGKGCSSGIKPARKRITKHDKGDKNVPE